MGSECELVAPGGCLACQLSQSIRAKTNSQNACDSDSRCLCMSVTILRPVRVLPRGAGDYNPRLKGGGTEVHGG